MKKTLSWFLALVMLATMSLSMLPAAFAEDPMVLEWYYNDTEPPVENDWFKAEVEKAFNVELKPVVRPGPDQRKWYDLEIAAGTHFDYFQSGGLERAQYNKYVEKGLVKEISREMIAENMPNYMKWAKKFEETFKGDIFQWWETDGKLYCIPTSRPCDAHRNVLGIRKDWLDNLGLDVPVTIDEFEEVLRAFTEDDPDGNGQNDTYGITGVNWKSFTMAPYCQAFGTSIDLWYEEDGVVKFGTVQPETKKAIELMNRWHSAGYIVPEAFEQDWEPFRSDLYNSKAGMGVQNYTVFLTAKDGWMLPDLLEAVPTASFVITPGIQGPDGDVGCQQFNPMCFAGIMFNYDLEDEKIAKYMQVFDALACEDEWLYKAFYGEEGVNYTKDEEGNVTVIKELEKPASGMVLGNLYPFFQDSDQDRQFVITDPELRAVDAQGSAMATGIFDLKDAMPVPCESLKKYGPALQEILDAYLIPLIKGERPLDDFDLMVEEWNNAGGSEVVAEMQYIYDTYMK